MACEMSSVVSDLVIEPVGADWALQKSYDLKDSLSRRTIAA